MRRRRLRREEWRAVRVRFDRYWARLEDRIKEIFDGGNWSGEELDELTSRAIDRLPPEIRSLHERRDPRRCRVLQHAIAEVLDEGRSAAHLGEPR